MSSIFDLRLDIDFNFFCSSIFTCSSWNQSTFSQTFLFRLKLQAIQSSIDFLRFRQFVHILMKQLQEFLLNIHFVSLLVLIKLKWLIFFLGKQFYGSRTAALDLDDDSTLIIYSPAFIKCKFSWKIKFIINNWTHRNKYISSSINE